MDSIRRSVGAKAYVSLYMSAELHARAKRAAAADGRSLSNYLAQVLERTLPSIPEPEPVPGTRGSPRGHQVDLDELTGAIARTVEQGPASPPSARRPRRGK